jgi:hypothetical protein
MKDWFRLTGDGGVVADGDADGDEGVRAPTAAPGSAPPRTAVKTIPAATRVGDNFAMALTSWEGEGSPFCRGRRAKNEAAGQTVTSGV